VPGGADRSGDAERRVHSNSWWCRDGPRISLINGLCRTKESRAWPGMPDSHPSWRPPAMGVLSGFSPRARFPRMGPATWANDVPLDTVGDHWRPLASDGMWPKRGPGTPRSREAALRVADLAGQGRSPPAAPDKRTRPATAIRPPSMSRRASFEARVPYGAID